MTFQPGAWDLSNDEERHRFRVFTEARNRVESVRRLLASGRSPQEVARFADGLFGGDGMAKFARLAGWVDTEAAAADLRAGRRTQQAGVRVRPPLATSR